MSNLYATIAMFIATTGKVGYIRKAPGTFGSLAAIPLIVLLYVLLDESLLPHLSTYSPFGEFWLFVIIIALTTLLGGIATRRYMQDTGIHDPKEVVIDEVVGMFIVLGGGHMIYYRDSIDNFLSSFQQQIWISVVGFVLFRFFDIVKPWPVSWADTRISGALGVMLDDIFAAFWSLVILYALSLYIMG